MLQSRYVPTSLRAIALHHLVLSPRIPLHIIRHGSTTASRRSTTALPKDRAVSRRSGCLFGQPSNGVGGGLIFTSCFVLDAPIQKQRRLSSSFELMQLPENHEISLGRSKPPDPVANSPEPVQSNIAQMYPERLRSCVVCGNEFASENSLRTHLFKDHPEKAESVMMDKLSVRLIESDALDSNVFASINRADGNPPKLELFVRSKPLISNQEMTSKGQPSQFFRIDVDCFKENSHINNNAQRMLAHERGHIDENNPDRHREWHSIVSWLDLNSMENPSSWVETVVRGREWHLLDFYHHILSKHRNDAFPHYPIMHFDDGSMKIYSKRESVEKIQQEYLERLVAFADVTENPIAIGTRKAEDHPEDTTSRSFKLRYTQESASPYFIDHLQGPATWSKESLCAHFERVIHNRRSDMMGHSPSDELVIQATLNVLLFESPVTRPCVSWTALYQAFSFLVERELFSRAWEFLRRMQSIGFHPNVEFYNKFLSVCGQYQRSVILKILLEMDDRGIKANTGTWISVMSAAPTPSQGQRVGRRLRTAQTIKDPRHERKLARAVIACSFGSYLDQGRSIPSFVQFLDKTFNQHWPSDEAAAELMDTLARRLRMLDAVLLADSLMDRVLLCSSAERRKGALHAILTHCMNQSNTDLAVWAVVYFGQQWPVKPLDHIILELLFRTAWRSQMHNVLRVVWKYAVSRGEVNIWTWTAMHNSLWARIEKPLAAFDSAWTESAAAVACGVDPAGNPDSLRLSALLDVELNSFWNEEPVDPFPIALAQALIRDKLWRVQNKNIMSSLEWKIEHSIEIGTRKKKTSS